MATIWYEVFPVTLSSQQALLLGPPREHLVPPWMISHQPRLHPNTQVVEQLLTFFGGLFEPDTMIVHSTSWRYELATDQVLLTYLAVLPQGVWLDHWSAAERIVVEPIGSISMVFGDHLAPPPQIDRMHVLAHALDHLAQLCTYDPAIQSVLEPAWYEILQRRCPRVAGYLHQTSSRASAVLGTSLCQEEQTHAKMS